MFNSKDSFLFEVLDGSPFFGGLSMGEREKLMEELLEAYPQLCRYVQSDIEVGYEASWLVEQSF